MSGGSHRSSTGESRRLVPRALLAVAAVIVAVTFVAGVSVGVLGGSSLRNSGITLAQVSSSSSPALTPNETSNSSGVSSFAPNPSLILGPTLISSNYTAGGTASVSASGGVKFGATFAGYPLGTDYINYKFTTPEGGTQDDTVFTGFSTWDNGYVYDQMGFEGCGHFGCFTTVSGAGCSDWCAYFSFGFTNIWSCTTTYDGYVSSALQRDTAYQLDMSVVSPTGQLNGNVWFYVYYEGPNNAHQLVYSNHVYTGANSFPLRGSISFGACQYTDTQDYEEWYYTNTVENWPAFNVHTSAFADFNPTWSWSAYQSTPITGFTGLMIWSGTHGWSQVNIDNEPYATWVGTWFGNGEFTVQVTNTQRNTVTVGIDPLADPNMGYTVYYAYDYCTVPCGDVSFSPAGSPVQSDNYFYSPNAQMVVTLPSGFPTGTYSMNLYTYDPNDGSWQISMWWLVVVS